MATTPLLLQKTFSREFPPPKIVILPGPHKTGSTSLQCCMVDWTKNWKTDLVRHAQLEKLKQKQKQKHKRWEKRQNRDRQDQQQQSGRYNVVEEEAGK
jgi:hypothetical protein